MILIIGPEDIHTLRVKSRVEARGEAACILTSDHYPAQVAFSSSPNGKGRITLSGSDIQQGDISGIYWYGYSGVCTGSSYPAAEAESALGSFLRNLDCRWVNHPDAVNQHQYKFHQLQLLRNVGIRVPDTLISNHPEDVRGFYDKHNGKVICKPIYQGLMLHPLSEDDLTPDKLDVLRRSPTLFQEYIEGQDIRVHIIGERFFPSAIVSEQFNYKASFKAEPIVLPDGIIETCKLATRTLGLTLAGVDIRLKANGEYVMFEANPSPQYMTFEDQWGDPNEPFPLTEALIDCLLT